jgi:hypothetical protein
MQYTSITMKQNTPTVYLIQFEDYHTDISSRIRVLRAFLVLEHFLQSSQEIFIVRSAQPSDWVPALVGQEALGAVKATA